MSEMIERVAKALMQTDRAMCGLEVLSEKELEFDTAHKANSMKKARAAIAAMREPTKEMCKAGSERHMVSNLEEEAKIKYQWMIDEALKKK